ncbi:MAG: alpha/beta hydrolase [Lentisphaeria bacterium]|nr:alpha/beta hydrolase [Lentisphaeria bacterium]
MLGAWQKLEENYPAGYTLQKITYGTHEQQEIYLTLPAGKKDFPLIIWFHGGGLTGDEWQYPSELWNGEYGAAIIRHRTSGGPFNALDSLTDSVEATAWVLAHLTEIGAAPEKVFLGGLSAGGWLSAMIGMNPELLAKYGFDNKCFAGLLLVSGQMTTHFQLKKDLGYNSTDYEPVIDQYAPIRYASKDLPPVILITGAPGMDMPGRPEENAFMAATLRALGHTDAEHFALPGHDHFASFCSCDFLLLRFMDRILNQNG